MIELDPSRYWRLVLDFVAAVEAHTGSPSLGPHAVPPQGP
jgi:hypothetical protein